MCTKKVHCLLIKIRHVLKNWRKTVKTKERTKQNQWNSKKKEERGKTSRSSYGPRTILIPISFNLGQCFFLQLCFFTITCFFNFPLQSILLNTLAFNPCNSKTREADNLASFVLGQCSFAICVCKFFWNYVFLFIGLDSQICLHWILKLNRLALTIRWAWNLTSRAECWNGFSTASRSLWMLWCPI